MTLNKYTVLILLIGCFALGAYKPAAIFSAAATDRLERTRITYSGGTPSTDAESGNWISSLTDSGLGHVTLNLTSNIFSATPVCTCAAETSSATCTLFSASSTTIVFKIWDNNPTLSADTNYDSNINVLCQGAR